MAQGGLYRRTFVDSSARKVEHRGQECPGVRDGYCRIRSARKIRQPSPEKRARTPRQCSCSEQHHERPTILQIALQRDERHNARSGSEKNRVENRVQYKRLKRKTPVKLSRRRQNKVEYCNYSDEHRKRKSSCKRSVPVRGTSGSL